jgi:hypothetical protein
MTTGPRDFDAQSGGYIYIGTSLGVIVVETITLALNA